jgi:hypothetical protein
VRGEYARQPQPQPLLSNGCAVLAARGTLRVLYKVSLNAPAAPLRGGLLRLLVMLFFKMN